MSLIQEVATMTAKGQITVPKPIRQALGGDVGGDPAGAIPCRVPSGEYARATLPPLAAGQDRQTVPAVLPL